jgi:hypothetical protein
MLAQLSLPSMEGCGYDPCMHQPSQVKNQFPCPHLHLPRIDGEMDGGGLGNNLEQGKGGAS